jgi:cytosine/adenosine deaminase-related metal-dependent hydrolase
MLGVAGATGFSASVTAQGAPNPGATAAPRTSNFILRGGYVITLDRGLGDIPVGDVHVRNGEIAAVAPSVEAPGAEIINAQGMIVMPGCVDTHSHVWNSLLKNLPRSGAEYFPLKDVFGKHHTPIDYYRANRLFLTEALNAGITTVINYAHNTQSPRACGRRNPRHEGERAAWSLCLRWTRSPSARQSDRSSGDPAGQATMVWTRLGRPYRSRLWTARTGPGGLTPAAVLSAGVPLRQG